jgi:hypothetical protein
MKNLAKKFLPAAAAALLISFLFARLSSIPVPAQETVAANPSVPAPGQDIVAANGCVDKARFDREWRRYSDINDLLAFESRSLDAQHYQEALEEIREARVEVARLKALVELGRQNRLAVLDYNRALKAGHKANLLRTFFRMAWITYNTVGGPAGRREFAGMQKGLTKLLFEGGRNVPTIARAMSLVKKLVPKQYSKVPGNSGKVVTIGLDATIEYFQALWDTPDELFYKVVAKIMETAGKEYVPVGAELSDQELDILRNEHIELRHLEMAIEEIDALDAEHTSQIEALEAQIAAAQGKTGDAEQRERRRMWALLNKDCLKKPIKIRINAPAKVLVGEPVSLAATISGGSGEYRLEWFGPGGARAEGRRNLQYRPGAVGPHLIVLNVTDLKLRDFSASAGVLLEAVMSLATVLPPPPTPPTPVPPASGPILLETLTVPGKAKAVFTSFTTEQGRAYILEVSGEVQVQDDYLTYKEDGRSNGLMCNNLSFIALDYPTPLNWNRKVLIGNGKRIEIHHQFATFDNVKISGTFTVKVYETPSSR